jgi:hypothetical protein
MRNGQVFELPTPAHRTTDSVYLSLPTPTAVDGNTVAKSELDANDPKHRLKVAAQVLARDNELLRTPTASQGEGGALGEEEARKRGNTVGIRDQAMDLAKANGEKVSRLMPTPNTMDHLPARTAEQKAKNKGKGGYSNVRETVVNDLMPTPVASEGTKAPSQQTSEVKGKTGQVWLSNVAKDMEPKLPTPQVDDSKNTGHNQNRRATLASEVYDTEHKTNWGKFEPAIKRWEETIGRPAPAPTKPDGKDGAHRLSAEFTEWMMGVPAGWIVDVGLTRNEELKACGNGVVPQQAALALRVLLEGITLPSGGGGVKLPTPTVSDTYTDNLKSSQQSEGSMHSVTLPQAVRMVAIELEVTEPRVTTPPQTDNSTIGMGHSNAEDRQ